MATLIPAEEHQQRAELAAANTNRQHWANRAAELDGIAYRMRQLAEELHRELDLLGDPLLPIRALHTTATWEGNAATQSRQRLDIREDRFRAATRTINGLAASLFGEADTTSRQASAARSEEARYRSQVTAIEMELGAFDHI